MMQEVAAIFQFQLRILGFYKGYHEMINTVWKFLVKNGNTIMLLGRLIVIVCLVMLVINMLNPDSPRNVPTGIIVGGVVIYVIGFIASRSKDKTKHQTEEDESEEL